MKFNSLTQYNTLKEILEQTKADRSELIQQSALRSDGHYDLDDEYVYLTNYIKTLENHLFYAKLQFAAIALAVVGGTAAAGYAAYAFAPQIAAGASAAQAQASAAYLAAKPHLVAFGMAVYSKMAEIVASGNAHLVQPFLAYAQALGAKLLATVGVDPIAHATAATVTGATAIAGGVTGGVYAGYKAAKAVVNFAEDAIVASLFRFEL